MKVLLIDDHPLILSALQSVIQGLDDDVSVVGVASAAEARQALRVSSDFDLVLLDLKLGDANGFDVLVEFRNTYPALPVVVVSGEADTGNVLRAIDLGAMGFVPKRASNDMLFEALRLVMSGAIYVPQMSGASQQQPHEHFRPTVPGALYAEAPADSRHAAAGGDPSAPSLKSLGMTPRQTEVLSLLLQGKPNKLIARDLNVTVETVKDHVAAVMRALGVSSRTQAVLAVSRMTGAEGFHAWKPSQK